MPTWNCYSAIFSDFYGSHVISMSNKLMLNFPCVKTPDKKFAVMWTRYDELVTICDGTTAHDVFMFNQDLRINTVNMVTYS